MAGSEPFRLMYRSRVLIADAVRAAELGTLFARSRAANRRVGVTGALLISDEWFVQVLEGGEDQVRAIYARIEADPRHDTLTVLEAGRVAEKVFPLWKMARVYPGGGADVPLVADAEGVTVAVGPRSTAARDAVLDVMRDAARGGGRTP